jgi:DNA polymerase-3 subunit alpha
MINWHRHDCYSLLDGTGEPLDYAELAAALGQGALAQTNHATMSGALHHITACWNKDASGKPVRDGEAIIPIPGVEVYFRPDRTIRDKTNLPNWHLCLWAKNLRGWHNLLRLTSIAYKENTHGTGDEQGGFYDKPCVDFRLLELYCDGLIASTGCISSYLSHLVSGGDHVAARDYLHRMHRCFGDDFVYELQPHDFDDQRTYNLAVANFAQEFGAPLLATSDAHYLKKDHAKTQQVAKMMSVRKSFKDLQELIDNGKPVNFIERVDTLYMMTEHEMARHFVNDHPHLPGPVIEAAIKFSDELLQRIVPFRLDKALKLPKVDRVLGAPAEQIVRSWVEDGLQQIFDAYPESHWESWPKQAYRDRLEYEWGVLKSKGVLGYFAMVGDLVRWAKSPDPLPGDADPKKPIRVGLGRGSAAGCLISYLIGIVGIDPISHDLMFERFLNPDRKGMPDIDLDFDSERRDQVKEYVIRRYGRDYVADIITHQTLQPKAVLQDVAKVFDIDYLETKAVTDTINIKADDDETTLAQLRPINTKLDEFASRHPEAWEIANRLEGLPKNSGKHAAGVIIAPFRIADRMPLERDKDGGLVTGWSDTASLPVVSDNGWMKVDFLGIAGLTKHEYACTLIAERHGSAPDLNALDALRDPYAVDSKVMEAFQTGRTIGVFQCGSPGMTHLLRQIKPTSIVDLSAANALYRPGPMHGGSTWEYARLKHSGQRPDYPIPDAAQILDETYGLIVFQEQVMRLAQRIGGLSGGDADMLRKAMGKLYRLPGDQAQQFMARWYEPFMAYGLRRGHAREALEEIWRLMVAFGSYGFNKSHSQSYALQAYQDMWLKTFYPLEFYAALLSYPSGSKPEDKQQFIDKVVREARYSGFELQPPDINRSGIGYRILDDKLTLGLTTITGVGEKVAKQIERQQPFADFDDFVTRCPSVNAKPFIECGALDPIADRAFLMSSIYKSPQPDYLASFDCGTTRRLKKPPPDGLRCIKKGHEMLDCQLEQVTEDRPQWRVWEHLKHNHDLKTPRPVPDERFEPSQSYLNQLMDDTLAVKVHAEKLDPDVVTLVRENIYTQTEIEDEDLMDDSDVIIGGEITAVVPGTTRKGDPFANVTIVLDLNEWSVKLWSPQLSRYGHLLAVGKHVMVKGRKNTWNASVQVIAQVVDTVDAFAESMAAAA